MGIIVLMSECRGWRGGGQGRAGLVVSSPDIPLPQQVGNANASSDRSPGKMGSRPRGCLMLEMPFWGKELNPQEKARPPDPALENSCS